MILALSVAFVLSATQFVLAQDALPSWHDTAPKRAIIAFVEKVTKEGSPEFVAPSDRVAVFDNDGMRPATRIPLAFIAARVSAMRSFVRSC